MEFCQHLKHRNRSVLKTISTYFAVDCFLSKCKVIAPGLKRSQARQTWADNKWIPCFKSEYDALTQDTEEGGNMQKDNMDPENPHSSQIAEIWDNFFYDSDRNHSMYDITLLKCRGQNINPENPHRWQKFEIHKKYVKKTVGHPIRMNMILVIILKCQMNNFNSLRKSLTFLSSYLQVSMHFPGKYNYFYSFFLPKQHNHRSNGNGINIAQVKIRAFAFCICICKL